MFQAQQTIESEVSISGIGLHSGQAVNMCLKPAPVDSGITFKRVDLKGHTGINVSPFHVREALMCTLLASPDTDKVHISTIEHLMSALCIFAVDNLIIEVDAAELPVMDGSSAPFVFYLEKAGIRPQDKARKIIKVVKKVRVEAEDKYAEVLPAKSTSYRFEIRWDHPVIAKTPNVAEFDADKKTYIEQICKARTFGFVEQLKMLHAQNLAKGASLENAVGISENGIANPEGLRYEDEFVKHKLLDAIGDFYIGGAIIGRFNCYKSGHALNNQLLRRLYHDASAWESLQG